MLVRAAGLLRQIASATPISGSCSGSRAQATVLIAGPASTARRTVLRWAGNTAPTPTRDRGTHLTTVLRCLLLEAHGYAVTVTELVGWEHSMKNELIIAS